MASSIKKLKSIVSPCSNKSLVKSFTNFTKFSWKLMGTCDVGFRYFKYLKNDTW